MDLSDPGQLQHAARTIEEAAATARQAVAGLSERAGPQTWVGAAPRRLADGLEQAVGRAVAAAAVLDAQATAARAQAVAGALANPTGPRAPAAGSPDPH